MTLGMQIATGFETVAFCEINPFCQEILSSSFPGVPIIPDIKDVSTNSLRHLGVHNIDGIVAGLPCPPFSLAGKRKASQDERNLFNEFFRILGDIRPRWAVIENVPGLFSAERGEFFKGVISRFSSMGYVCVWGIYSAAAVGAVHLRKRMWVIAYAQNDRRHTSWHSEVQAWANETFKCSCDCDKQTPADTNTKPTLCGNNDGISGGLDGCLLRNNQLEEWLNASTIPSFARLSREEIGSLTSSEQEEYRQLYKEYQTIRRQHKEQLKALGNAVVPQCAARIFELLNFHIGATAEI